MDDYLEKYKSLVDYESLTEVRKEAMEKAWAPGMKDVQDAYENMPEYRFDENDFSKDEVIFGTENSLDEPQKADLKEKLMALSPWRKGPFNISGIDLDAEWRSDFKWNRVLNQPYRISKGAEFVILAPIPVITCIRCWSRIQKWF